MNDYLAYCGLDCETCEARLATVHDDAERRERVAKLWSELNGVEITPEMVRCTGAGSRASRRRIANRCVRSGDAEERRDTGPAAIAPNGRVAGRSVPSSRTRLTPRSD